METSLNESVKKTKRLGRTGSCRRGIVPRGRPLRDAAPHPQGGKGSGKAEQGTWGAKKSLQLETPGKAR